MSVAELEQFLHIEFPQALSAGDIAKASMVDLVWVLLSAHRPDRGSR
jgi:hypothetical protein